MLHFLEWKVTVEVLPGQVAGVAHPALLSPTEAAAGLADVQLAVQTLTFGVDQELEGLKTTNAVRLSQAALIPQQLPLSVFLLNPALQFPTKHQQPEKWDSVGEKSRTHDLVTFRDKSESRIKSLSQHSRFPSKLQTLCF